MSDFPVVAWQEHGKQQTARWRSENGSAPPKRVMVADDTLNADAAYHLACEGTAILWRGDYQNAKQLLQAIARRIDRKPRKSKASPHAAASTAEAFHLHRQAQAQRARTLGMLLLPFAAGHHLNLRRAPEVKPACEEAYGVAKEPYIASLRELLGLIGAHEWRKKGVRIDALGGEIHPHYGVFSPVRGEYIQLVAEAPLPSLDLAFDIGTGTGVLAALLAQRGVKWIVATDQDARALACARENMMALGFATQVQVLEADLFPQGRAPLIVCNPPWIPARPSAAIEYAIYDPESRMLKGFLDGLRAHLAPGGEGWLILSDIAEHLGLRTREALMAMIDQAGLQVIERHDIRPKHPKVTDTSDPLHVARSAEVTSLWRLAAR
jgi:SAM-dependent methyltransferase